jgi:hypothetical protein
MDTDVAVDNVLSGTNTVKQELRTTDYRRSRFIIESILPYVGHDADACDRCTLCVYRVDPEDGGTM